MDLILLERIERLGQMGDVVKVKDGYARNFLLPQKKALRATKENRAKFEQDRSQLEAQNLERKSEAEAVGQKIDAQSFTIIRQAGDSGQLYGSVTTRDIAAQVTEGGVSITRNQVTLDTPIKVLGLHDVRLVLHPEVSAQISINVARTPEEAERQARGEDVTVERQDDEEVLAAEDVFEDEELARQAAQSLEEDAAQDNAEDAPAQTEASSVDSGTAEDTDLDTENGANEENEDDKL